VREDGWMGASFCMHEAYAASRERPLTLRYLLHAHAGGYNAEQAQAVHAAFAARPGFKLTPSARPHQQYEVEREASKSSPVP
jgi:hypothetical protein